MSSLYDEVMKEINKEFERICTVDIVNLMKSEASSKIEQHSGKLVSSIWADKVSDDHYIVGTHGCNYAEAVNNGRRASISKYPSGPKLWADNDFFRSVGHPLLRTAPAEGKHFVESTIRKIGG